MQTAAQFMLVLAAVLGHVLPMRACCFSLSQAESVASCCPLPVVRAEATKGCCQQRNVQSTDSKKPLTGPIGRPECCCSRTPLPATVPQEPVQIAAIEGATVALIPFEIGTEQSLIVPPSVERCTPRSLQALLCRWLC